MSETEKNPRKKIHRVYDENLMQRCLASTTSGEKSMYGASKAFGIPVSSIRYRLSEKWTKKIRKGPPTVLLPEEEMKIIRWLKEMECKGFPVVKETLLHKVKMYLENSAKVNPFKNNVPGRKWFLGFLDRHKGEITMRTPESVTAASAVVSEQDIRNWFTRVEKYIQEKGLGEILLEPNRVYNGDETSFFLNPKTKAVLATPGNRNVYEVEHASSHTNITVMFTFGADGSMVPPDVVLPMQRIRPELLSTFPGDWGIGKSTKGWMDVENFMLYVKNVFYPFLRKNKVTFPVLYFVDGHSSHTAAEVADLCLDLGIILVALYPNTTRITQPADVSIFKPLKSAWKSAVTEWQNNNCGEILSLMHFGAILQNAIKQGIKEHSIVNGFRVCGLFPFNADNVDYSKCLGHSAAISSLSSSAPMNNDINEAPTSPTSQLVSSCLNNENSSNQQPTISVEGHSTIVQSAHDSASNVLSPVYVEHSVIMPYSVITDSLCCIGPALLSKIRSANTELNDDEMKVKLLYEKLLKPFDNPTKEVTESLAPLSPIPVQFYDDSQEMQNCDDQLKEPVQDIAPENTVYCADLEQHCSEPVMDQSLVGVEFNSTLLEHDLQNNENITEHTNNISVGNKMVNPDQRGVFQDGRNKQNISARKMSISDFLKTPSTPKRNVKHRNYKKKYHPILTAKERLQEIQRIEDEKQNTILEKQAKAEKRRLAKLEAEKWKKLKVEMRERKKQENLMKKQMKENLKKEKYAETDFKKRKNKELLQSLKLG